MACSSSGSHPADAGAQDHTTVLHTGAEAGSVGAAGAYAIGAAGLPATVVQSRDEDAGLSDHPAIPAAPAGSPGPASARRWKPPSTRDTQGGGGHGPAFLPSTGSSGTTDPSGFGPIGGAGFSLGGVCERCGWDIRGVGCQSLVYTVPTTDDPTFYQACWGQSFDFWSVSRHSPACAAASYRRYAPSSSSASSTVRRASDIRP